MPIISKRKLYTNVAAYAPAAGGDSAELTQFISRITAPSAPRKALYAALIDGLVADGVWTLIDGLYVMAAVDAATARTNLKQSSYGLTVSGTVTFTADQGYTGDGSTGSLTTGYDPSTAGGHFPTSGDEGTLASYDRTSDTSGGFNYDIHIAGNTSFIVPLFGGANCFAQIGGGGASGVANTNTQGSYVHTRTSPSAYQTYKNGATLGAAGSTAPNGATVGVVTLLSQSGGGGFANRQLSAAMFGGKVTGTQALAYMSRINTYMTALGINVY